MLINFMLLNDTESFILKKMVKREMTKKENESLIHVFEKLKEKLK